MKNGDSPHFFETWGPAVLWAAFIFSMSTGGFSGDETRGWVESIARLILPPMAPEAIELANAVLRKAGHVSEYFVFALLLDRGFRLGSSVSGARALRRGLAIAILFSASDEAHQAFVPSRTASLLDCGFDAFGAAMATLLRMAEVDPLRLAASPARAGLRVFSRF